MSTGQREDDGKEQPPEHPRRRLLRQEADSRSQRHASTDAGGNTNPNSAAATAGSPPARSVATHGTAGGGSSYSQGDDYSAASPAPEWSRQDDNALAGVGTGFEEAEFDNTKYPWSTPSYEEQQQCHCACGSLTIDGMDHGGASGAVGAVQGSQDGSPEAGGQ